MKTRTKLKSTKVPDEVLTSAPLQKALSSTERSQIWRAKIYKDPKRHNNLKKTDRNVKPWLIKQRKRYENMMTEWLLYIEKR